MHLCSRDCIAEEKRKQIRMKSIRKLWITNAFFLALTSHRATLIDAWRKFVMQSPISSQHIT